MSEKLPIISILGGTGNLGFGLALRWVRSGYRVIVGSRDKKRSVATAKKISNLLQVQNFICGKTNINAASECDIAVMTVPACSQFEIASLVKKKLHGKILVDTTVPLIPPKILRVQLPPEGSAVAALQKHLGEGIKVVSAFQNIAASQLIDLESKIDCDVLVCGNKKTARQQVITLANAAGLRAWHAGPINNSAATEAMTSLLLFINKNYQGENSGLRITGANPKNG